MLPDECDKVHRAQRGCPEQKSDASHRSYLSIVVALKVAFVVPGTSLVHAYMYIYR